MKNPNDIIKWLKSNRDYNEGVDILSKYSIKFRLVAKLKKRGYSKQFHEKLTYELWKYTNLPESVRWKKIKVKPSLQKKAPVKVVKKVSHKKALPPSVSLIMKELQELYNKRALLHKQLQEMPEDNLPTRMKQREDKVKRIAELSERIEPLYDMKEDYFTKGVIPVYDKNGTNATDKKKVAKVTNEFTEFTDVEKLKKLSSCRAQRSKLRKRIADMPDGPKRDELTERLTKYMKQIELLESLIEK
jgi:hypothetical protein